MIEKLFNFSINQRYLPNIQDSFSNELKAGSTIRKIAGIVKVVLLLPWLIVKDAAYNLNRLLGRVSKKESIFSGFYSTSLTKLKYLSSLQISGFQILDKTLKLALVGAAVLGVAYPHLSFRSAAKTSDLSTLISITTLSALVGASSVLLKLKKIADSELRNNQQFIKAAELKDDLMKIDYSKANSLEDLASIHKKAIGDLKIIKGVLELKDKASFYIKSVIDREFGFMKNYDKLLSARYNKYNQEIQLKQSDALNRLQSNALYEEIAKVKADLKAVDLRGKADSAEVFNKQKSMKDDILPRIKNAKEKIEELLQGDGLDEQDKVLVLSSLEEDKAFLTNWEKHLTNTPVFIPFRSYK